MSLFADNQPKTLEEALTKQAESAKATTEDNYTQGRKKLVAQQAHSGRLMSGVSDYNLGDFDTEQAHAESGIDSNLAGALAGVPSEDWLNGQQFNRQVSLAQQIADMMKPSTLEEVFQGIGTAGRLGGQAVAMGH